MWHSSWVAPRDLGTANSAPHFPAGHHLGQEGRIHLDGDSYSLLQKATAHLPASSLSLPSGLLDPTAPEQALPSCPGLLCSFLLKYLRKRKLAQIATPLLDVPISSPAGTLPLHCSRYMQLADTATTANSFRGLLPTCLFLLDSYGPYRLLDILFY